MELGASTSYHSKSQPKRSHDDPKTIQFHVFQTISLTTLATFLGLVGDFLVGDFPKWVPKSVPDHFRSSFAHRKELQNSGVNKSNGATADLFWPSNFWAILAVLRVVPLGNSCTVPGQILLGLQSRNTTKGSSEIIIGHQ